MPAAMPKNGGSWIGTIVRFGGSFAKCRPMVVCSVAFLPDGWKCDCRIRSLPFGNLIARPCGNFSGMPPTAQPPIDCCRCTRMPA